MKYIQITTFIFAALLFCFSPDVQAQDKAPPTATGDTFKDWNTMRNHMQSQGLDPQQVSWTEIDMLCAGLKSGSDDHAYNQCSYTKGRDWLLFRVDKDQCTTQSLASYPDGLLSGHVETFSETDKKGVVHSYQRTLPPTPRQDLLQQRAGAVIDCMQRLGWVDANSWAPGKRSRYCQ